MSKLDNDLKAFARRILIPAIPAITHTAAALLGAGVAILALT